MADARLSTQMVVLLAVPLFLLPARGFAQHDQHKGPTPAPPPLDTSPPEAARAPLFDDLGSYGRRISTESALAQRYFDQGLVLTYGFNHAEAVRSFREAARIDPSCGICHFGAAYALGPNINLPMFAEAVPEAWSELQEALAATDTASPVERALIDALATRYAEEPPEDRAALDLAWANALRKVYEAHPEDDDVAVLFAESLMDLHPWDYYLPGGTPRPETAELMEVLDEVLERRPDHPGALHFHIHAVEATAPQRAEASADRLAGLVPGAGHLVHMPSHIYVRLGRYADSVAANERAAAADESYLSQCHAQGLYPAVYYPHNIHFLWYSAALEGRQAVAETAAKKLVANLPWEMAGEVKELQTFMPIPLLAWAQFGRWDDILATLPPDPSFPYARAMWHYARGLALVAKRRASEADGELAALSALGDSAEMEQMEILFVLGKSLSQVARRVLAAELARVRGDREMEVSALREAVRLEDALPYNEPPYWYSPVRQRLGAALLDTGAADEAAAVYEEDLRRNPETGWSLFGLAASLEAQGKGAEAEAVRQRLAEAWARSDVQLVGSRF